MVTKKDKCVEIMGKCFGPASAKVVQNMTGDEETIVQHCRQKVMALLGPEKAREFDNL